MGARFHFYAKRVRSLSVGDPNTRRRWVSPSVLGHWAAIHRDIFPLYRDLKSIDGHVKFDPCAQHIAPLLVPTLTSLDLSLWPSQPTFVADANTRAACANLERLTIYLQCVEDDATMEDDRARWQEWQSALLAHAPRLRNLATNIGLGRADTLVLAQHAHIATISSIQADMPPPVALPPAAFAHLRSLRIERSVPYASLMATLRTIPAALRELSATIKGTTSLPEWDKFVLELVRHTQLEDVSIQCALETELPHMPVEASNRLFYALGTLRGLVHLYVSTEAAWSMSNSGLLSALRGWPALETCSLRVVDVADGHSPVSITLQDFLDLLHDRPALRHMPHHVVRAAPMPPAEAIAHYTPRMYTGVPHIKTAEDHSSLVDLVRKLLPRVRVMHLPPGFYISVDLGPGSWPSK
jgi:hypothetical protein